MTKRAKKKKKYAIFVPNKLHITLNKTLDIENFNQSELKEIHKVDATTHKGLLILQIFGFSQGRLEK